MGGLGCPVGWWVLLGMGVVGCGLNMGVSVFESRKNKCLFGCGPTQLTALTGGERAEVKQSFLAFTSCWPLCIAGSHIYCVRQVSKIKHQTKNTTSFKTESLLHQPQRECVIKYINLHFFLFATLHCILGDTDESVLYIGAFFGRGFIVWNVSFWSTPSSSFLL